MSTLLLRYSAPLLIFVHLVGCAGRTLNKDDLKTFVLNEENGLYKVIQQGDLKVEVMYRPLDLIVEQNIDSNNPQEIQLEHERLDSLDYFIIKFSKNGKEIENEFAGDNELYLKVINYLNGGIASDINLTTNKGVIHPEMTLFAPSFGASSGSSVLLAFKSRLKGVDDDATLIFNDSFLGIGRCEFSFETSAIKNCPKLKF